MLVQVRDYLHFQPDRVRQAARVLIRVLQVISRCLSWH
jgi:hypothetical protein